MFAAHTYTQGDKLKKADYPLIAEYAEKVRPLIPLARRAYGAKNQKTPAHEASQEYTRLLKEYHERGGSLLLLAQETGVTYSGMRRRVFTADLPTMSETRIGVPKRTAEETELAISRVIAAKSKSTGEYHKQLAAEYADGFSLGAIARGLGITSAGPLYYGVQKYARTVSQLNESLV